MHASNPWRLWLAAVTLAFAGLQAHAEDKLIDGFGTDQRLDSGFVTGADILAGSRELLALAPPDPDAVRVDDGWLVVDTRTERALVRYASPQPGTLFNLALDDVDSHGEWLLTYRAIGATELQFSFRALSVSGLSLNALRDVVLEPSADFVTVNLGTLVELEFPLYRTRDFAIVLEFDTAAGNFEIDALRVATPVPVPEPATAALWLAGLGALAAAFRRAARRRRAAGAAIAASCAALLAGCDGQPGASVPTAAAPATCTAEQWHAILDRANAGLEAESRGSNAVFLDTMRSWRSEAPACRQLVARLQPVAARCTAAEARQLMQLGPAIQAAAARGDLREVVSVYDRTAAALTPACWRAANQHSHPRVVQACSPAELEDLSAQAPAIQRGVLVAAATLDLPSALALADRVARLTHALAPPCQAAIVAVMQPRAQGGRGMPAAGAGLPSVLTHGNGAYSVPGTAYCGPSGCVLL